VSLLTDLDAFFTEHGRCGDLDAGRRWADRLENEVRRMLPATAVSMLLLLIVTASAAAWDEPDNFRGVGHIAERGQGAAGEQGGEARLQFRSLLFHLPHADRVHACPHFLRVRGRQVHERDADIHSGAV
jgi:hypothetical protein